MTDYTYETPDIADFNCLYDELIAGGVADPIINLNGTLVITAASGMQTVIDTAVTNAGTGTLQTNKSLRLNDLSEASAALSMLGVTVTIGSVTGSFPIDQTRFDFAYYESLVSAATRTAAHLPFSLETTDENIVTIATLAEAKTLADAATNRLKYIYLGQTNADSSKGEIGYIIAIKSAANQTALDAIVDTRT